MRVIVDNKIFEIDNAFKNDLIGWLEEHKDKELLIDTTFPVLEVDVVTDIDKIKEENIDD